MAPGTRGATGHLQRVVATPDRLENGLDQGDAKEEAEDNGDAHELEGVEDRTEDALWPTVNEEEHDVGL